MGVKSTTKKMSSKIPTTFPAITTYNSNGVIFLISQPNGRGDYMGTVIGNPNKTFPIGWTGTCSPENHTIFDGPVTLQNE